MGNVEKQKEKRNESIRKILRGTLIKFGAGLAVAFLWDHFHNADQPYSMVEQTFFLIGLFYLAWAWFQYLRRDGSGCTYHPMRMGGGIIGDRGEWIEKADPYGECKNPNRAIPNILNVISSLIAGLLFLIPAIFVLL